MTPPGRLSAFTVDVEDWYQSCVDLDAPITERVVRNVDRILELLDALGVKGTFFVQGRVAETYPALMAQLVAAGHELQSHGYSHRPLWAMSRSELRRELEYAKKDRGGCFGGARLGISRARFLDIEAEPMGARGARGGRLPG